MKLKQITLVTLLALPTIANAQNAELLGAGAKWTALIPTEATNSQSPNLDDGETALGLDLYFEHSVPFLPNVRAEVTDIEGSDYKYLIQSSTFYYNAFDADAFAIDLGLGLTFLKTGKVGDLGNSIGGSQTTFDSNGGYAYLAGEYAIPTVPNLALIASVKKSISSDLKGHDIQLGAQYTVNMSKFDWVIQGGYRDISHEVGVDEVDYQFDTSGLFLSFGIDF